MKILEFGLLNGPEVVVILALALILFGAKRLPELARSLGNGLKEFKKATREVTDDLQTALYDDRPAPRQLPTASPNSVPTTEAVHSTPAETPQHATTTTEQPAATPPSHS